MRADRGLRTEEASASGSAASAEARPSAVAPRWLRTHRPDQLRRYVLPARLAVRRLALHSSASTPPADHQCNPPCTPGKKCQNGQCVEAPISCSGLCPDNAKCCPSCGSGNFCWPAEVPCRC